MRRYILFGSRNNYITHSFIRLARSRNHQILCIHPHKAASSNHINNNRLFASLGGNPLRYSFRDDFTGGPGHRQIRALVSMLKGVDGVVWAAHPLKWETTRNEKREERVKEYMEDLRGLLTAMKIGKTKKFVFLSMKPEEHVVEGAMGENERMTTLERHNLEKLEENFMNVMSKLKTLDWTIVRSSYPNQDPHTKKELSEGKYIEWVNAVAKAGLDALENGTSRRIVDVNSKSVSAEAGFRVQNIESTPILEDIIQAHPVLLSTKASEFKQPSKGQQTPALLHSAITSADPFLKFINPVTFPGHFSKQPEVNIAMTKLLEDVRIGREQTTSEVHTEQRRNDELRRRRELARLAAQKKGLPPPGADVRILQRVYASTSLKPKISNSWKRTAINLHSTDEKLAATAKPVYNAEKTESTAAKVISQVENDWETTDSRYRETLEDKREGLFETLADVLLNRSTDKLTPQLADPSTSWQDFKFHPRWQYSASRLGKKRRR